MTGYLVGKRTIEPAPDITTPDGALIDARNILARARELSVDGPEAVWLLLHHAAQRFDAEIARELRAERIVSGWCSWCGARYTTADELAEHEKHAPSKSRVIFEGE